MKRLLLYIGFSSTVVFTQQLVVKTDKGSTTVPVATSVLTALANDSIIVTHESPDEKKRWIVELQSPSILQQKQLQRTNISLHSSERSVVLNKIKTYSPSAEVKIEFVTVLNGFTVSATTDEVSSLRSITDIKKIYEDITVASQPIVALSSTGSAITAPDSLSAKGIKIGIIDSGIDYTHEALGRGFGAGFRIAGGYDFVNNDADPMDDNGHGTHVAGIVAGHSSTIKGIASDAELYAYKVLNAQGSGYASDVLAALESAVRDSVDIINLSLGSSSGNPNDILSEAVNRVVESGIVVVAAAGNTGEYESIHSPGVAEHALTVGATDGTSVASFSAKGPVPDEYRIKPDVVAPGVGILSAKNGGGYVTMSGTSMATPLVTSIAAVIKEMHPDWNAFQIKDAIISHARDLRTSLFAQGNGSVSNTIFSAGVVVSPAHISFGFDPPTMPQWSRSDTIRIFNAGGATKKYEFRYLSTNPALTVDIQPKSVDLQPSAQRQIVVTVTTNNLFLSNNKHFSGGYTGNIYGVGDHDTVTIPFTFFKGNVLRLQFSETPWQVMIHNQKNYKVSSAPKTDALSSVMEEGTYDVVASFLGSHYVVKENIAVSGLSTVTLGKEEATHAITVIPSDEKGDALPVSESGTYSVVEAIVYKPAGFACVGLGGGMMTASNERVKYFSDMSDKYSFGHTLTLQYGTSLTYTFDTVLDSGITASQEILFAASDLKKLDMKYTAASSVRKLFPITWTSFIGPANRVSVTFYNGNDAPLTSPFVQTNFISNRKTTFPIFQHREAFSY